MGKFRKKVPMKRSRKMFSKSATKTHKKNVMSGPLRGGIRL